MFCFILVLTLKLPAAHRSDHGFHRKDFPALRRVRQHAGVEQTAQRMPPRRESFLTTLCSSPLPSHTATPHNPPCTPAHLQRACICLPVGTKEHWRKNTLWEESTRVLMTVSAPGITTPGTESSEPTSLLDLFPTLLSLSKLPARPELEGVDLTPVLQDPSLELEREAVLTVHKGVNFAVRSKK